MAKQLDNSIEKPKVAVETAVSEPIVLGKFVDKSKEDDADETDEEELELDLDDDEQETAEETVADEVDSDDEEADEPETPAPQKPKSKEQRKIQALKNEAKKLQTEKAELQKKLEEKMQLDSETQLAKKYAEEGYDEKEAKQKAKADVRQETIEKQLELLTFERKNRRVLEMYPDSENDIDRIMTASKASGMTVEQVCRGLYGDSKEFEKERRMAKAITGTGSDSTSQNTTVNKALRTAEPPKKSTLTQNQLQAKRMLEKMVNKGKTMSDEDFLRSWNQK